MISEEEWGQATIEESALAMAQIDALLPEDATLLVEDGSVEIDSDVCVLAEPAEVGNFAELFDLIASACGRSAKEIAAARKAVPKLHSVQIGATSDLHAAQAVVDSINQEGFEWQGFYEQGDFPGLNASARVETVALEDGREVHRILVGNYLSRTAAEADHDEIEEGLGVRAFVRRM